MFLGLLILSFDVVFFVVKFSWNKSCQFSDYLPFPLLLSHIRWLFCIFFFAENSQAFILQFRFCCGFLKQFRFFSRRLFGFFGGLHVSVCMYVRGYDYVCCHPSYHIERGIKLAAPILTFWTFCISNFGSVRFGSSLLWQEIYWLLLWRTTKLFVNVVVFLVWAIVVGYCKFYIILIFVTCKGTTCMWFNVIYWPVSHPTLWTIPSSLCLL